jgi:polyphosphate kinase
MTIDLTKPDLYINRELSWLDFNRRVLEEAEDHRNPLLERVKFLGIVCSNLDEFYEVRVAGLMQLRDSGGGATGPDRLTPDQQLREISKRTHESVASHYRLWNEDLLPALAQEGIHIWDTGDLQEEHRAFITQYWREELEPILTPIVIDPAHPFPRVLNKALCIGVMLESERTGTMFGVVTVPRVLPRILRVPGTDDSSIHLITLAAIVAHQLNELFEGYEVTGSASFRATRNSELYVNEEEADNLLVEIAESLENRRKGDAVRLEIEAGAPARLTRFLQRQFKLKDEQVYVADGPVNLNRVLTIYSEAPRPDLKFEPYAPVERQLNREPDLLFDSIRSADVLVHHPYESFNSVTEFIRMAVIDPRVLAIKQTLYRTGEDSEVVRALIDAAQKDKEVTVLVELKARFDEASNIEWAKRLEESGVHVVYGLLGMKTHCKLSMIVRREEDGLRRYAHLGTGNYNHTTARLYTDIGMFTAREDITREVAEVFNLLTAGSAESFRELLVGPTTLMSGMLERIDREIEHAAAGRPAAIIAKMNGLTSQEVIRALYRASMAGVEIDLIVRGICCLRPGIPGVSDHIRVFSLIGRYLEHSRIFHFANGGDQEIWAGSADWMNRNLRSRVEVVFPILEVKHKERLWRDLQLCLGDRLKTRQLQADGTYRRVNPQPHEPSYDFQTALMDMAQGRNIDIPLQLNRPVSDNGRKPSAESPRLN